MANFDKDIEIVFSGDAEDLKAAESEVEAIFRSYGVELTKLDTVISSHAISTKKLVKEWKAAGYSYEQIQEKLKNVGTNLRGVTSATARLGDITNLTVNEYRAMERELSRVNVKLNSMRGSQQKVAESQRLQLANVLKYSVLYGAAAAALYQVDRALSSIVKRGMELEATKAVFKTAFGGADEAARQLQFVTNVAHKYSLELSEMRVQYRKFATSAKLSGATLGEVHSIFENMSKAARGLHLSSDQLAGAFLAITQIFSKGKVQAEELRGQLGERFPGAMAIMAKSVGVSTQALNKMMEQGKLTSDAMIGFAKAYGDSISQEGLDESLESLQARGTALVNTWDEMAQAIYDQALPSLKSLVSGLQSVTGWVRDFAQGDGMPVLIEAIKTFGVIMTAHMLLKFAAVVPKITAATMAMIGFTGATNAQNAATMRGNLSGFKFSRLMESLGGKTGVIMLATYAIYEYNEAIFRLIGLWNDADSAIVKHVAKLNQIVKTIDNVKVATLEQIDANNKMMASTIQKAKAEAAAANQRYNEALIAYNRFKRIHGEGMPRTKWFTIDEEAFNQQQKLKKELETSKKLYEATTKQVKTLGEAERKLHAVENTRIHVLKRAAIIHERSNEGEAEALKLHKKLTAEEAKRAAAEELTLKKLKIKTLATKEQAIETFKLTKEYKNLSEAGKKQAIALIKQAQASKKHTTSVRKLSQAQKDQFKINKELGKQKARMMDLVEKELYASRLKLAQLGKNREQAYLLYLDSKKIYGQDRKILLQKRKEVWALQDELKHRKKLAKEAKERAKTRAKALKLLEKHRKEAEAYGNEVRNIIPKIKGLTEEENKLNAEYIRKTKYNKAVKKEAAEYSKEVEKQKEALFELRKKLGLVTQEEIKQHEVKKYTLIQNTQELESIKELIKETEEYGKALIQVSDALTNMIIKSVPGLSNFSKELNGVVKELLKVTDGKSNLTNVFSKIDTLISPNKGGGATGIIGNAIQASQVAKALGGSKNSQIGAALGSVTAAILGLPPSMGAVLGGFIGQLTTVFRKGAKNIFDQYIDATAGEGAYTRKNEYVTRTTAFGEFGISDKTKRYGRNDQKFKTAIQSMLDTIVQTDQFMRSIMSDSQVKSAQQQLEQGAGAIHKTKDGGVAIEEFKMNRLNVQIHAMGSAIESLIPATAKYTDKLLILHDVAKAADEWQKPLKALAANLGNTTGIITATTYKLVKAAGGSDKLNALISNYVDKTYTTWEKLTVRQNAATQAINEFNKELAKEGKTRITNIDQLKHFIETLRKSGQLQTTKGQELWVHALQVVDAYEEFDNVQKEQEAYLKSKAEEDKNRNADEQKQRDEEAEKERIRLEKEREERNRITTALYEMNLQSAKGIEVLAGSLEKLQSVTSHYAETVFTEAEQKKLATANAAKNLKAIAESLGLTIDEIDTRKELRAQVEKLSSAEGEMTDERKQQILTLMQSVDSVALLEDAHVSATQALDRLPESLKNVVGGFNDTVPILEEAQQDIADTSEGLREAAGRMVEVKDVTTEFIEKLKNQVDGLGGQTDNSATALVEAFNKNVELQQQTLQAANKNETSFQKLVAGLNALVKYTAEDVQLTKENIRLTELLAEIAKEN